MERLDKKLADLLHGSHTIEGNHEQKVIELTELMILAKAALDAGWQRHTGDWDWEIEIDGHRGYDLGFKDPMDNFTACVDSATMTHVVLVGMDYEKNEEATWEIEIDSITEVLWEEL